jgi:TRAP-type mannitol/chloroaromatic compound transport system permease large subunit
MNAHFSLTEAADRITQLEIKLSFAEDLLDSLGQLFGPIRGGLGYAVVFVGALLAATTGVVAASVIAMAGQTVLMSPVALMM